MSNAHVTTFRALHESGCFVLPNPWDEGSAKLLRSMGARALATTSAGHAFSRGKPDAVSALGVQTVVDHVRAIVEATPLPVSADFQDGFAREPEELARNVTACVAAGAAGLSIEDATGYRSAPLYERSLAIEKIRAARAAINATGIPVVLTARCEAFLVGVDNAAAVVMDRLVAFAEAGADCLFAPMLPDLDTVAAVVKAVAPKPVNVLVSSPASGFTVPRLAELGVRRVSVGSALSRVALGAFRRAAAELLGEGTFETFRDAAPFAELDAIFGGTCNCASYNDGVFTPMGPRPDLSVTVTGSRPTPDGSPGEVFEVRCNVCSGRWDVAHDPFGYHQPGYYWRRAPAR